MPPGNKPLPDPMKNNFYDNIDGLVQERCNSSALAMELRLSCTNPPTFGNDGPQ